MHAQPTSAVACQHVRVNIRPAVWYGLVLYHRTVRPYHRTKHFVWANSSVPEFFGSKKIPGTQAISALSTEFGPFAAPLRVMMAHENECIARENEKKEARSARG